MRTPEGKQTFGGTAAPNETFPQRKKRVRALPWDRMRSHPIPKNKTANASLKLVKVDGKKRVVIDTIPLWVFDLSADFSLSGSTAQSHGKRDFYPRNFNQPSYRIQGQTWNERHYGLLGENIRSWQHRCVRGNFLMQFHLPGDGPSPVWFRRANGQRFKAEVQRNMKGPRPNIAFEGYVADMPRTHKRFVHAPEYSFDFIVSRQLTGPLREETIRPTVLPTSWTSFVARGATGFIRDPDEILLSQQKSKSKGGQQPKDPQPDVEVIVAPGPPGQGPRPT